MRLHLCKIVSLTAMSFYEKIVSVMNELRDCVYSIGCTLITFGLCERKEPSRVLFFCHLKGRIRPGFSFDIDIWQQDSGCVVSGSRSVIAVSVCLVPTLHHLYMM